MRKILFAAVCLALGVPAAWAQSKPFEVKVRAILVDSDLNQKPVPHLALELAATEAADLNSPHEAKTDFDGKAEFKVVPGKYRLTTPLGVEFQGRHFTWDLKIDVSGESCSIDLSNDNARAAEPGAEPPRKVADLTLMFQKYRNSVLTVWSEIGSGTGFIADSSGLILTNQHVIGPSELNSVQFDSKRKVAAKVLAFDAERDIAVLYADLSAFPGAAAAPLASAGPGSEPAVEGERVFTIGSPLGLKKIITSGIVSKVEARAILSDVNINHGNSGGPLFNSLGEVIGITTFLVPGGNGPGVAGVIRIDQAFPALEQARKKMKDASLPSARLLPVEPSDPYPIDSLKEMARTEKLDTRPYVFTQGGFDVALGTPVLEYTLRTETSRAAIEQKERRTRKRSEFTSSQPKFEPLQDLHEWAEYTGEYKPVLLVQAAPQLRETFLSALGREIAPQAELFGLGGAPRMKFKTDFYRMKLLCGGKEIEPIQPGKAASVVNAHSAFINVTDATYVGIYSYPPDAIAPACGKVTLQLFSEKDPPKSESKDMDQKTVDRIWRDFQPYVAAHGTEIAP